MPIRCLMCLFHFVPFALKGGSEAQNLPSRFHHCTQADPLVHLWQVWNMFDSLIVLEAGHKGTKKECRLQGIRTLNIFFWRLVSHWFSLYVLYRFVTSYVWICSALVASASCDICPMIHSGFVVCLGLPCQSVQMTVKLDVCACGASTRRRTRDKGPPFVWKKHKGIQRDSFPTNGNAFSDSSSTPYNAGPSYASCKGCDTSVLRNADRVSIHWYPERSPSNILKSWQSLVEAWVTVFYDFIQLTCLGFEKEVAGFGKANISWKICIAIRTGWFCIPQRSLAVRNCLINFCWCWKVRVVLSLCFPCSTTTLTETLQEFQRIYYMYRLYVIYPKWVFPSMRPGCLQVSPCKSYDSENLWDLPISPLLPYREVSLLPQCQCFLLLPCPSKEHLKEHLKELYPFSTWPMQVLRRSRVLFCFTAFAKYWA